MKKVAQVCWRVFGVLLLLSAPLAEGRANPTMDPDLGYQVAAAEPADATSQVKKEKLKKVLDSAAEDYSAGRFDTAADWYESALQLDPENVEVKKVLENARMLRNLQRKRLEDMPRDANARDKYVDDHYDQAYKLYKDKEYDKAERAFFDLWLVAGDYKGKTLKYKKRSAQYKAKMVAEGKAADAKGEASKAVEAKAVEAKAAAQQEAKALDAEMVKVRAAIKTGYYDDARRMLAAVHDSNPDFKPARKELKTLDKLVAKKAAAEKKATAKKAELAKAMAKKKEDVQVVAAPDAKPVPVAAESKIDDVTRIEIGRLMKLAENAEKAGNVEEALALTHKVLDIDAENYDAKVMLKGLDKQQRFNRTENIETFLSEGDQFAAAGQYDDAVAAYKKALKLDAQNKKALNRIEKAQSEKVQATELAQREQALGLQKEIDGIHGQALDAYNAGDLKKARDKWEHVLKMVPTDKKAQTWLEQTQANYERVLADEEFQAAMTERKEEAVELLRSPITISTESRTSLAEFMRLLSFATINELEYYIVEGAEAMIQANFVDKPLSEVLDVVLLPAGLAWSIDDRNVITIEPNLITKTYSLSPAQITRVRTLMSTGNLQTMIWGQTEKPAEAVDITLDERQNLLLVTGSEMHVQRMDSFLPSIQDAETPGLEMRIYKIRKEDGSRIKALINSIITTSGDSIFDQERKILVDEGDLIVHDTLENINKIEELLLDRNFIMNLRDEKLDFQAFSLVPRDVESTNTDQVRNFTRKIVEAIEVYLYASGGKAKAAEEGRRLWFDEASLQLTIIDTPSEIRRVADYIESLPQLSRGDQMKVIFLEYAVADSLASSLERILDLTTGEGGGAGGGQTVTFKLRRGQEKTFRDARIRLVRIEEGDEDDRHDDSVELSFITNYNVNTITLQELDTQFQDDYEVTAEDVLPSSGLPGEGSARISIRYVPQQFEAESLEDIEKADEEPSLEKDGISINPFSELNALVIRYQDVTVFNQALDLIAQLDKPIRQVEIETKFVEVNETRAKEFSADFDIAGLGSGRDIDWNSQLVNTRFAQDLDEYRDVYSPPIENPTNANLIKGTTMFDVVIGNFPSIHYSLRLLEAEGIINVVNGPRVTAINGEEAEFRIEQYSPSDETDFENDFADLFNPLDDAFDDLELQDQDETDNSNIISAVVLRVTPEITSEKSIILNDLSAELIDFEGWLGTVLSPSVTDVTELTENQFFTLQQPPQAITNQSAQMLIKRKRIDTDARISNGGTIVIGGWTGERSQELTSGIPVLRNLPYFGKMLFSRAQRTRDRTTLMIFLTGFLVE